MEVNNMIRNFKQGVYSYDTFADFPNQGKDGYLYRAIVTNRLFICEGGVYSSLTGGSDSPYRGQFGTIVDLKTAYPTDQAGASAAVGAVLYIYDDGWKPSGSAYRGRYDTLSELETDWPTDIHGALAIVVDTMYVYDSGWIVTSQGQSGGTMDHNALNNLQGGETSFRGHLGESELEFVKEKMSGVPATPINYAPADGELDVYQAPLFVLSPYSSPLFTQLAKINIMIAKDQGMTDVVYWDDIHTSDVSFEVPAFYALIEPDTVYYWQARFEDENGLRSAFSAVTGFTTLAAFEPTIIKTPIITYPFLQETD
jgi:hypothetical protein